MLSSYTLLESASGSCRAIVDTHLSLALSLSVYVCVCVYIYILCLYGCIWYCYADVFL